MPDPPSFFAHCFSFSPAFQRARRSAGRGLLIRVYLLFAASTFRRYRQSVNSFVFIYVCHTSATLHILMIHVMQNI
jgi:hypothetical protein